MPFYGQTWFLSTLSGLIAVLLYHVFGPNMEQHTPLPTDDADSSGDAMQQHQQAKTKAYIAVFITVAVLVYGSFLVAQSTGSCRLIDEQPDIQTGGRPPF